MSVSQATVAQPMDWVTTRIGDVGSVQTGNTPPTSDRSLYGHDFMFVSPADMGSNKYINQSQKMLTLKGFARSRRFPVGSVLFVCIGSTIGKIGLASKELTANQQINAVIPGKHVDSEYLYYALGTVADIVKRQAGEQAVPLVNKTDFSNFAIQMPPIAEQRRIAGSLQEADDLISWLERLITKKQSIKQGMMQQLLTSKTRLPGFSSEWQSKKLSELLDYEQPGRYLVSSTDYVRTGIPVLTAGKTFVLGHTTETGGVYEALPVIIFDDFTTASKYVAFPFKAKSSAMKMLSAKPGANLRFVFERMQQIDFVAVDHKRRWIAEFSKLAITVPPIEEQQAIASVIEGTDDEIDTLERRLHSIRAIKQGMMQELLTGRTRLMPAEVAA